ncbi:MAG: hypothetical protein K5853_08690, partial [Lachnospiraceae bacterium]|nr:hypothetical protein [Lachnospiraceae bacterium]
MNLLLLTKVYFPDNGGGISQAVMSLADCFRGQKEEILVCRPGQKEPVTEDAYDGVKVIRCRQFMDVFSTPLSLELLRQWKRRTDENSISVYNFPYPLGDLGILFHCYRGKLVVWWHCDFVSYKKLAPLYRPLVKHTLKKADAILVSSDGTID